MHPIRGLLLPSAFLCYVAFVFISVWNIVTSIFVEKALLYHIIVDY